MCQPIMARGRGVVRPGRTFGDGPADEGIPCIRVRLSVMAFRLGNLNDGRAVLMDNGLVAPVDGATARWWDLGRLTDSLAGMSGIPSSAGPSPKVRAGLTTPRPRAMMG